MYLLLPIPPTHSTGNSCATHVIHMFRRRVTFRFITLTADGESSKNTVKSLQTSNDQVRQYSSSISLSLALRPFELDGRGNIKQVRSSSATDFIAGVSRRT